MKLKIWVEALLIVIAIASVILMTYDVEISMMPFIVGSVILVSTSAIITEYGRLPHILKVKLEQLISR